MFKLFKKKKNKKNIQKLWFMFNYGALWCLWTDFGFTLAGNFNLSTELISEMESMCKEFDTRLNWDYPQGPLLWSAEQQEDFNKRAENLYKRVVEELGPEYEVELHLS